MKETPLTGKHIDLGAKMAAFAGYNMPISYAGIKEEHHCVRNNVGVFDVSHMGEFIIKGKQALDLIQYVTTNNAARLKIGEAQYSCLPNKDGGIVDDLLIYRLAQDMCAEGEQAFMLVVNASNIQKDLDWINQHNHFDTRVINISDQTGLLAVQGPNAIQAMQPLTDIDLKSLSYYTFTKGKFGGMDNILISATGYTGSGGFEIYANNDQLARLWDKVFEAGQSFEIQPIGLGARDTLRMEMGYCLYGNDIDDTTSPIEAGLGWITKTKKSAPFISQEKFAAQKTEGVSRKLCAFKVDSRRVPRHGYPIQDGEAREIGTVTSGTMSPTLETPIGLGYVKSELATPGTEIFISVGKKTLPATIVKLPFIER